MPEMSLHQHDRRTHRINRGVIATFVLLVVAVTAPTGKDAHVRAATAPTYVLRSVAKIPGAVRVVERSSLDSFVYVVSRNGTVTRIDRDGSRPTKVLDVTSMTTTDNERGLLGLAFRRSGGAWEAFINYTDLNGHTTIARWRVRQNGTFVRQPGLVPSVVIRIEQPYANHNGGDVVVGPDNMLYIGMGDGGSGGDPERRAMNLTSLLGKILRINPTATTTGTGNAYRIPADNPWVGKGRGEIWSMGLRNPWRFTFDPAGSLWVADVGQNSIEEVSVARATSRWAGGRGVNFGWSAYEGTSRYNKDVPASRVLMPVLEYTHDDGRCSISGAAVATVRSMPRRAGWFYFGDFCSGTISAISVSGSKIVARETVAQNAGTVTSLNGTSRAIYYTTLDGTIGTISDARP